MPFAVDGSRRSDENNVARRRIEVITSIHALSDAHQLWMTHSCAL